VSTAFCGNAHKQPLA